MPQCTDLRNKQETGLSEESPLCATNTGWCGEMLFARSEERNLAHSFLLSPRFSLATNFSQIFLNCKKTITLARVGMASQTVPFVQTRQVSFAKKLKARIEGSVSSRSICLADVDKDDNQVCKLSWMRVHAAHAPRIACTRMHTHACMHTH